MNHRIEEAVVVPLLWNDDENCWELDIPSPSDPLNWGDDGTPVRDECGCKNEADEHSQEHDEIWGRALATEPPSADDLAHMLGFSMVKAGTFRIEDVSHPRTVSPNLRTEIQRRIRRAVDWPGEVNMSDVIDALIPLFQSVDEHASRRALHAHRAGVDL